MQNIELKALYPDLERARELTVKLGATHRGALNQSDTFFHARFGRLKLRELRGESAAELIAYHREDKAEARSSDYELAPISDPMAIRTTLARSLGIMVTVVKQRELWIWKNVRIHLDRVEDLGNYIEFEAVLDDPTQADAGHLQVKHLISHFGIRPEHIQEVAYADLLMSRST